MKQLFELNGELYRQKHFFCTEVATKILPSLYGTTIKDITYEQLAVITSMLNHGWSIIPGFYGEKTEYGVMLKPNLSWFILWAKNDELLYQYTACVNYNKGEIVLYDSTHQLAIYNCINDMYECMPYLDEYIPVMCTGYNDKQVEDNVDRFELDGFDDEIYLKSNPVYNNMSRVNLTFEIDKNKIVNIPITAKV